MLVAFTFNACDDGNAVVDEVYANTTSGIVLRTISVLSDELPIGTDDAFFGVEVEMQDEENGALVESLEVYLSFNDNTIEEGATDYSTDEVLAATIPSSAFTIGQYGLPRYSYTITLPEMLSALSLSDANVDGSDTFDIRFETVLVDGRRFSNDDNTDTSTGSFFASPFIYRSTVVCPPKAPTPGIWTIEMQDSYGDGWQTDNGNGGSGLTATLNDGTVFEVGLCSPYLASDFVCTPGASSGLATIEIPEGTESVEWFFPGDFYGEITFQIITPNGNVVADIAAGAGAGPVTIDFCKD